MSTREKIQFKCDKCKEDDYENCTRHEECTRLGLTYCRACLYDHDNEEEEKEEEQEQPSTIGKKRHAATAATADGGDDSDDDIQLPSNKKGPQQTKPHKLMFPALGIDSAAWAALSEKERMQKNKQVKQMFVGKGKLKTYPRSWCKAEDQASFLKASFDWKMLTQEEQNTVQKNYSRKGVSLPFH